MTSTQSFANRFVLTLIVRAVAMGAVGYIIVHLLWTTHMYATVTLLVGLLALLAADTSRSIARLNRSLDRVLGAMADEAMDLPILGSGTVIDPGMNKAISALRGQTAAQARDLEYARAMLDTVSAALFVLADGNRLTVANRAARTLAGAPVDQLHQLPAIGPQAAQQMLELPVGARQILRLANGQRVHVSCAEFLVPGAERRRLLSMQRLSGELDAVEVKAWNDMAQMLAHEMMNSLTPIASLSESLEQLLQDASKAGGRSSNDAEAELAGALEAIKRRSLGLLSFVERYRSLADLPPPSLQDIDLSAFTSGIERLMSATMKDRGIVFEASLNGPVPDLRADPELLEQAVINLLQNAVEAVSNVPEPCVRMVCTPTREQVTIAIIDNGTGLPGNEHERIFVPFFTTKRGGSGIGLSIARYVALAHGKQLEVCANEPRGAIFSLVLPLSC